MSEISQNEGETSSLELKSQVQAPKLDSVEQHRSYQLFKALNPTNKFRYQSLLQSDYLLQNSEEVITQKNVSVKCVTWNLAAITSTETESLEQLLVNEETTYADIYMIGFQETVTLTSVSSSEKQIEQWCDSILAVLSADAYTVVCKTGLLGLTSILISKTELAPQISTVQTRTVGLGYLNWYNKGCIELRFSVGEVDEKLNGVHFQWLNMHLTHGSDETAVEERKSCLKKVEDSLGLLRSDLSLTGDFKNEVKVNTHISYELSGSEMERVKQLGLPVDEIFKTGKECLVFVSGDLNFRISDLERTKAMTMIEEEDYFELLQHDQLTQLREKELFLSGFKEPHINFKPTFKLRGQDTYDEVRFPSYTDRIFYSPSSLLKQLTYACGDFAGSDHLYVTSEYQMKLPIVDFPKVKQMKTALTNRFDKVLNSMELVEITPPLVTVDAVVGITESIGITFKNLTNETLRYRISECDKKRFRKSEVKIIDKSKELAPREKKTVSFQLCTSKLGHYDKNYIVNFDNFQKVKFIGFSVGSNSIIGIPIAILSEKQFENIVKSFEFITSQSRLNLLSRFKKVDTESSLVNSEIFILKSMTLSEVDFGLLQKLNQIGMERNEGSISLITVLYLWLRHVPDLSNFTRGRTKLLFSHVINLIEFLELDEFKGFSYFGFLFQDEYELKSYLGR